MTSQTRSRAGAHVRADAPKAAAYTEHYAKVGPRKLHYLDYGTAGKPDMLCIHGGAAHGHWFDFVAPGFTADYHVRSLDLRGHGDSEAADPPAYTYADYASDIDEFVQALDLRDFVLMGHSMGGTVSLVYAASYPSRVKKLIVIDSTVNLSAERIGRLRDIGSRPGRDYDSKEEMVSKYRLRPGNPQATPEVVRYIAERSVKEVNGAWRYKFDREVYATREIFDGTPLWSDIRIPALLVKGAMSERITPEVITETKVRCPHVVVKEVPHSDHHVTLDNPQGFIDAVTPWLAAS
jgi:pimeloyl-ACP methyl ester carboxylesterase